MNIASFPIVDSIVDLCLHTRFQTSPSFIVADLSNPSPKKKTTHTHGRDDQPNLPHEVEQLIWDYVTMEMRLRLKERTWKEVHKMKTTIMIMIMIITVLLLR